MYAVCVQVVTWCHGVQVYTLGQFIHMVVKVNIYSNKTRRRREVTSLRENRKAILTFFYYFRLFLQGSL